MGASGWNFRMDWPFTSTPGQLGSIYLYLLILWWFEEYYYLWLLAYLNVSLGRACSSK